jgi:hypothetical protein
MGIIIQVEKDGLALRNVSGTEPGNEESTGTVLRADCDDFRKFLVRKPHFAS